MRDFLRISAANMIGFLVGVVSVAIMLELDRSEGGYLWPYASMIGINYQWFDSWYGPVQFSVLFGCIIALIISFIVTHLLEKL